MLDLIFKILIVSLASVVGAFLYRFRGGWPDIPRPIEQALFCLPLGAVGVLRWGWWGVIPYACAVWAVCKGHGRNADLGEWLKDAAREWYENNKFMKWLEGVLPPYWYDAAGLVVSGLSYTLPFIFISPVLALSGALKAPSWMIGKIVAEKFGWKIRLFGGKFYVASAWEWGELICGFVLWAFWSVYIVEVLR